jgi:hypothetical protein
MRQSDIRTTLKVYGDVVTDEMAQAHSKVVRTLFGIEQSRPVGAYTQQRPSSSLTRVILGWLLETRVFLLFARRLAGG